VDDGSAPPPPSPSDGGTTDAAKPDASGPAFTCDVSLCLTGASTRSDGSNSAFNVICDGPEVPSVVKSCDSGGCYNTFNSFLVAVSAIYPSLFAALDTTKDGKVDAADAACRVNILGFSWGGVAAVSLAQTFLADANVDASRRQVARLVVMDPYQPSATITVPAGVVSFWELRHSIASSSDCSKSAPLGPYLGVRPHCAAGQDCRDYDYSLAPTAAFPTDSGGTMLGGAVGHCDVPFLAAPVVRALFSGKTPTSLPPSVAVQP
jgi:pimeloyl-ACP methyl ester carboxylesterase